MAPDAILKQIESHPLPDIKGAYDAYAVVERFRASLLTALREPAPAVAPEVPPPTTFAD